MSHGSVIFDFDGVIANTEEIHLMAYNHALKELRSRLGKDILITPELYFSRYIVYGTTEGFGLMLQDAGLPAAPELIAELCAAKDRIMDRDIVENAGLLPGVRRLLDHLTERNVPCGICSGARRHEIEPLLAAFGLADFFPVITAIEDVRYGKPDPEGYSKTLQLLNELDERDFPASESLVIEDTNGGAIAAHAAGMRVLGVATNSPLDRVKRWSDFAFNDLAQVNLAEFDSWIGL